MKHNFSRVLSGFTSVGLVALLLSLTGCQNFFLCDKASCTGGSGGNTAAGNVAYVSNNVSASTTINGYSITKGTLVAATNSPYLIGITPTAMAVSRANGFLYAASTISGTSNFAAIYGWSIGSGGALTVLSGGNPLTSPATVAVTGMDVSPDGNWLIVTTAYDLGNKNASVVAYPISPSTGLINTTATLPPVIYTPAVGSAITALKVAPSGQFFSVAMGTGGVMTFQFNTSTGAITFNPLNSLIAFQSTSVGASDLTIDSNNFLYVSATSNVYVFTVSAAGIPTTNAVATAPTAAGGPFSIALDGTKYLYVGAQSGTNNLIYCFSIGTTGTLTALSTQTISAPTGTTKLAVDSTGSYLLALGYDSTAGLKSYSINSTTGILTSLDTAPTGAPTGAPTTIPSALALTH